MSEQIMDTETNQNESINTRLNSLLNEERLLKDISAVQLSKLKTLDDIASEARSTNQGSEFKQLLEENLKETPDSMVLRYLLGVIALEEESQESDHLRKLLDEFRENARWPIVDYIADRILEAVPESRVALRSKVDSTERLRGKKELGPFLERLAAIDRKNPDVARKYALSILEEDPERAIVLLKQAGETYARIKDYRNLEDIWNLLVQHDHKDLAYFEKIERILVGDREKTRVAAYLVNLLEPFREEEDWNSMIVILKKILENEPASTRSRSTLVRTYRSKYENHSLLDEFLKMSELTNNKKPVGPCIASFERNIVFDRDNYVYHRTRGVGKIVSIDSDGMVIDFHNNPGQKMSIQMAISSLKPLEPEHIWVRHYENEAEITEIFNNDLALFFEILLSSFSYRMVLSEIKAEVCGTYLSEKDWSKWWSRARTRLKKEPKFGFNPRKKDELILRERPMTLSEELIQKFQSLTDWNKKLELAFETLKDGDTEGAAELCVQYYREQEGNKDTLKRLHSYFFLKTAAETLGEEDVKRRQSAGDIEKLIKKESPAELVRYCADSSFVEIKRDMVNAIIIYREDFTDILQEVLFEVPIKVNRYIITELNRLGKTEALNRFQRSALSRFREHPEIFLWVARSILQDQWNYEWVDATREELVLLIFRLLKPLGRIETTGTRMKNMAIETIFGTTNITVESARESFLPELIASVEENVLRRMYALFREVPYVPDAHKENFLALIKEVRPNFVVESDSYDDDDEFEPEEESESLLPDKNVIMVSQEGFNKRQSHLEHLIKVEMPENSREIGLAQEKGDLRENAEYKAAMEKQQQLQAEIKRLDEDLKKARLIDPNSIRTDMVTIGSKVQVRDSKGELVEYAILSPWEADTDNGIISYLSPLGSSLIGKKPGDQVVLSTGDEYKLEAISRALT